MAVPEGWRGPEGARRILLLTSAPLTAAQLRAALPAPTARDQLAVLVVVPTLADTAARFRLGEYIRGRPARRGGCPPDGGRAA